MKKVWAARIFGLLCLTVALLMAFYTLSYGVAYFKYKEFDQRLEQRIQELDLEWEEKCLRLEEELSDHRGK